MSLLSYKTLPASDEDWLGENEEVDGPLLRSIKHLPKLQPTELVAAYSPNPKVVAAVPDWRPHVTAAEHAWLQRAVTTASWQPADVAEGFEPGEIGQRCVLRKSSDDSKSVVCRIIRGLPPDVWTLGKSAGDDAPQFVPDASASAVLRVPVSNRPRPSAAAKAKAAAAKAAAADQKAGSAERKAASPAVDADAAASRHAAALAAAWGAAVAAGSTPAPLASLGAPQLRAIASASIAGRSSSAGDESFDLNSIGSNWLDISDDHEYEEGANASTQSACLRTHFPCALVCCRAHRTDPDG